MAADDDNLPAVFRRNAGVGTVTNTFQWSMAPRRPGFAVGNNMAAHKRLHEYPDDRLREYYLLPGHLIKWYELYNKPPDAESWVWKWFPDGDLWRDAVQKFGANAVERITEKLEERQASTLHSNGFALDDDELHERQITYKGFSDISRPNQALFTPLPPGFVIFFHISLPDDATNAIKMVEEQLDIISASYAATSTDKPLTVFFNVAGNKAQDATNYILHLCSDKGNLVCRPMYNFDGNSDGETLHRLFQFCSIQQDKDKANRDLSYRVAYINNRGPLQLQRDIRLERLIRHLTMAVTSKMCVQPSNDSCNVCGLIFYVMWTLFFPGNIFTASCSYVNQLISPTEFEERMKDVIGKALLAKLRGQISMNMFPDRSDHLGLERYAIDHWIGSHPELQPCDLSISGDGFESWLGRDRNISDFTWAMAPRRFDAPFGFNSTQERVLASRSLCRTEFYYLAGHLLKWYGLYGKPPPLSSWVWPWFPEGSLWSKGVDLHGRNVIHQLTDEFADAVA
jgi:hypothetical protein